MGRAVQRRVRYHRDSYHQGYHSRGAATATRTTSGATSVAGVLCGSLLVLPPGFLFLLLTTTLAPVSDATVACNETYNPCERLLWNGSECRNSVCSNPFEKGCLHTLLNTQQQELQEGEDGNNFFVMSRETQQRLSSLIRRLKSQVRVCNRDDPPEAAQQGICLDHRGAIEGTSTFSRENSIIYNKELYAKYQEIRILSQNWESAYFASWILQILLSEILNVPTTIESGECALSKDNNFYNPENRLRYGLSDNWHALRRASEEPNSDCIKAQRNNNKTHYQACAHVMPEYWTGSAQTYFEQLRADIVEPMEPLGAIGQQAIFVTKFTAEADPTLLNLHGIQGELNRQKLARTFKRPTTWKDYCEIVSETNCTVPDDVSQRAPLDEIESERMFRRDLYTGHFRYTDDNNCTLNPTTCTGHIADFPCSWVSFLIPQMFHNDIALKSDGKEPGSRGYTYTQLRDMWTAANATRSNLVTLWWTPEAIHSTYLGTPSEMQKISLTWPTQECFDNRIQPQQRCAFKDKAEQVGSPLGACDEAPQLLHKQVVSNLYTAIYDSSIPEAQRSPAYDAIKAFSISELQYGEILNDWILRGIDKYGFDPRMATCRWVAENLDHVASFIPRSYPRVAKVINFYQDPLNLVALVVGCLALALTVASIVATYIRQDTYAIFYAQVEFLFLLLLGLLLVSAGAVVMATEPNSVACSVSGWFVVLGYTIQLVPLIVKVYAILRLVKAAERLRRIVLPKPHLFGTVAAITSIVVIFLICWVVVNPFYVHHEFVLTEEVKEDGETVCLMDRYCDADSRNWQYVAAGWFAFLMICATIMAFKTRSIREEFNESKLLGIMIYSHFLFLILLVASFLFKGALREAYLVAIRSIIYSCDSICTLAIYFLPKFTSKAGPVVTSSDNLSRGTSLGHTLNTRLSSRNLDLGNLDGVTDNGNVFHNDSLGHVQDEAS